MPKYLIQANYTNAGTQGLLKEGGSKRRAVVDQLMKSLGAKLESFYYAFGETDAFIIIDAPDHATVVAIALTVSAAGGVTVKTTVLLTPEDVDAATKKTVSYRPPGK